MLQRRVSLCTLLVLSAFAAPVPATDAVPAAGASNAVVLSTVPETSVGAVSLTTHARRKQASRVVAMPPGKRMCTGRAQEMSRLGFADWRIVGSDMNSVTVEMTVEGRAGRGKVIVEVLAAFAPEGVPDEEVAKHCSFKVTETKPNGPKPCSCTCFEANGNVRWEGAATSPAACEGFCTVNYQSRNRCTKW